MPFPRSSIVAAWELALRLRQRRDQVGVDVRAITQTLGFSRNYWSAVENERKVLSQESLTKLLTLLEFDKEEQRELLQLRDVARQRGWWTGYSGLLDSDVQRLMGMEAGAQSVQGYESLIVPGLLQTADYVRAITTPDVTVRQAEVDQRVEIRLRRQERLSGDNPLHMTAVLSEAALRQQIGGPAVLRRQLEHLTKMIEANPDTIEVRVIPFTATACGLFGSATVHLLDFESPRLPTVAWHETVTTRGFIDDPIQVRDISVTFKDALGRAQDKKESLAMIRQHIQVLD